MTESESVFTFHTPPDDVDSLHDFLEGIWSDVPGTVDDMDRMAFETALIELASNVIQHGNIGFGVSCRVAITADEHRISAELTDSAAPVEVTLGEGELPDEDAESGRGLVFIRMLVDEARHERVDEHNVWVLTKFRSTE